MSASGFSPASSAVANLTLRRSLMYVHHLQQPSFIKTRSSRVPLHWHDPKPYEQLIEFRWVLCRHRIAKVCIEAFIGNAGQISTDGTWLVSRAPLFLPADLPKDSILVFRDSRIAAMRQANGCIDYLGQEGLFDAQHTTLADWQTSSQGEHELAAAVPRCGRRMYVHLLPLEHSSILV